eukprot:c9701_g1_i1 orf=316-1377(-)
MEVCDYPCAEQDPNSLLSQLEQHPEEIVSQMPATLMSLPAPPVEKCDQIVVLDSSRIAMQIASGEIIWPNLPKPKEIVPKLEPDVYPFANATANGAFHPDLESTDLALGQMDIPLEKCKVRKRPRSASEDAEADGSNERQAIMRWKDVWVAQLIHVRGRMQAAFTGPQKQRIDLWQVIKNEMARTCHGFDKDSEACRKKWRRVYKEYRDEKNLHGAGGDASQKCRFFELLEYYMGERADGVTEPPVGFGLSVKDEMLSLKSEALEVNEDTDGHDITQTHAIGEAYVMRKPRKRAKRQDLVKGSTVDSESLQSMIAELVGIGKEMLQTTRQFEQDKLEVLHSLRETLREISGKI